MYGSCFLCDIFFWGGGEKGCECMYVYIYIYVNFKKKLL
jgi:hypothetical protein